MTTSGAALLVGLACAGVGGELFVRSAVSIADWVGVPARLVATTVAAFATSSPELAVSVGAARAGEPELALGDALGSNVVNFGVVMALALLLSGTSVERATVGRDYPAALLLPVLLGVLVMDGAVSRIDAAALLGGFLVWLTLSAREALAARQVVERPIGARTRRRAVLSGAVGLALLVVAARLVVRGATGIADTLGLDVFVTGAVIVALGTSVPEIATVVSAKIRNHHDVALGTIVGSNIFNGALIVSVAALIAPIEVPRGEVLLALSFGLLLVAAAHPGKDAQLPRLRGLVLLGVYGAYLATLIAIEGGPGAG